MRKIGWIMLILLISMLPLHASAYTLDALIGAMEVNNAELRKADEDVVQSRLDVKDAKAAYQPTVELTLMGMYMPNPLIDDITINTNDILAQIGRPPLPQGYDLTIYDGMESTYYNASLSVTQPLVTWGKITNSVHLYEAVAEARALQRDDKENQLIAELKARLSALYYIDQVEGLLDETIDTTESLVGIARSGEEEGAVLSSDVLDAEIEAKFEAKKKEFEELQTKYKSIKREGSRMENLEKRQKLTYEELRNESQQQICKRFTRFLSQRKAEGSVAIDHEQHTVSLSVRMDSTSQIESSQVQNIKVLSGGEKSFVTLSLIMATTHIIESPFFIMDEFDVFMDEANRLISLNSIIETARQEKKQFIFITPHNLETVIREMNKSKEVKDIAIFKMNDPQQGRTF